MTRLPTVLIIEDNEMNREILLRRVGKLGLKILSEGEGLAGLESAFKNLPDLIIMDVNMPGMDGIQMTKQLKSDPTTQHIPILVLTAHARAEEKNAILQSGCDEFETKPIDFDRLSSKIFTLLGLAPSKGSK
jgi:CheY-like chemotaxis protein